MPTGANRLRSAMSLFNRPYSSCRSNSTSLPLTHRRNSSIAVGEHQLVLARPVTTVVAFRTGTAAMSPPLIEESATPVATIDAALESSAALDQFEHDLAAVVLDRGLTLQGQVADPVQPDALPETRPGAPRHRRRFAAHPSTTARIVGGEVGDQLRFDRIGIVGNAPLVILPLLG